MYKFFLFLSVFILQNTNRCISYIINEIPTTFRLMQSFKMTVINKCIFFQQLYSSYLTLHVHINTPSLNILRIKATPKGSISIPDTIVTFLTFLTHELFSISDMFVSFTFLGGHCLYISCLLIYYPILGSELITASCKHDLIEK